MDVESNTLASDKYSKEDNELMNETLLDRTESGLGTQSERSKILCQ